MQTGNQFVALQNGRHELMLKSFASSVDDLAASAELALQAGVSKVLVEKPGALHLGELEQLEATAAARSASVSIAYNRRYYASVRAARERIAADGGVGHRERCNENGPGGRVSTGAVESRNSETE